jgi:hypothetical protein
MSHRLCAWSLISWGSLAISGTFLLGVYHARPGGAATPSVRWPSGSRVMHDPGCPNLFVFLHPRCPCSRASLHELAHIVAACQGRLAVHAIVLAPSPLSSPWKGEGIESDLAAIPGIGVRYDPAGDEARRFGVATSGHVLLYDSSGNLVFSGGITASRGHEGESYGRSAVVARVFGEPNGRTSSPVFGCPLATPELLRQEEVVR